MVVLVTGSGSGIGRAVSEVLARAGHSVYASLRSLRNDNEPVAELQELARRESLDLRVTELDVLSEPSCRACVDQILFERGRLDVVVNNAGMLMTGVTEAFSPDQFIEVLNTNAVSWLRVNRAVLPVMRRQREGVIVYVSSTTARISEPFLGPYAASKAAGEVVAEVMGLEVSGFGVESVIVSPGALTSGTNHFAHAVHPADEAVAVQYSGLGERAKFVGGRIAAMDDDNGGAISVSSVGEAIRDVLATQRGQRPARVVVDSQQKGVEELNDLHRQKQRAFFRRLDIEDLMTITTDAHDETNPSMRSCSYCSLSD